MLSAYAPLFRVPGATRFIAGTALSRTGGAMFGVAIIVMLSERRGSFGLAGAVSAVGLFVLAIAGPVIGRLVDKHGQRRVALPFVVFSTFCGVTVAVLSWRDAPAWTLFVFYGLSAVLPEPGPMSRARWAHIYRDEPEHLHTAMSFEQVCRRGVVRHRPGAGRARVDVVVPRGRPAARRAALHRRDARVPRRPLHRAAGRAARRPAGRVRRASPRPARRRRRAGHDRRDLRRQRGHRGGLRQGARRDRLLEHHPRGVRARVDPRRNRVRQQGLPHDDDPSAHPRGHRDVRARGARPCSSAGCGRSSSSCSWPARRPRRC